MLSKVAAIVKNFLSTDADALCLVPGERMYLMRGTAKTVVGREILSEDSFRAVAAELAPGEPADALADRHARIPYRVLGEFERVEIEFARTANHTHMMTVSRARPSAEPSAAGPQTVARPSPSEHAVPRPGRSPHPLATATAAEVPVNARTLAATTVASVLSAALGANIPGQTAPQRAAATPAPPAAPAVRTVPISLAPTPPAAAPSNAFRGMSATRPIDVFLSRMLESDASDLHLSSGAAPTFRVHGEISPQTDLPVLSSADVEQLLEPIFPEEKRREFAERSDTDFAYEIKGFSRFRVNVFRDRHGSGAVFRQIPIEIKTARDLNLPQSVVDLASLTKGLVLVTGPTGSGKSTTLAAIVNHINETRTDHIITIEDPIEFVHPNKRCLVNQREVGTHTRGFKDALRAALREDPDIVLVGEMRDLETIAIAIETAETGHLVFGTLHTTTAASTVDRIIDQFPEDRQAQIRVMVAESLKGVVAQILLKRIGGGRVAALEVLLANNAVANLIRDGKTFQLPSVMQTSKAQGMVLLNDSLLDLVKRGVVEPQDAYWMSADKPGLQSAFNANNIPLPGAARGNQPGAAAIPTSQAAPATASR